MFSPSLWAATDVVDILDYDHMCHCSFGQFGMKTRVVIITLRRGLGVSYAMTDDWLLLGDYSARFIHLDDTSQLELIRFMPGVGYRYSIKKIQMWWLTTYSVLPCKWSWKTTTINRTESSDTEFIQGIKAELNYGFAKRWIANGSVQVNRSDLFDEEIYHVGLRYLVTK